MDYTTIATGSQVLWRMLESYGHDPAPVFRAAGIDVERWRDPLARFNNAQLDGLWRQAVELVGDPCFGLRAMQCWHPSQAHALGYAWLASDTLMDALERLVRYFRLVTEVAVLELAETSVECRLSLPTRPHLEVIHERTDAFWAVFIGLCRMSAGERFAPAAVHLRRPEPPCAGEYYGLFKAPVTFGAAVDTMIFRREDLHRPLPTGNRELARANEQVIDDYLKRLDLTDVAGRVRARLLETLSSGEVDEERMAQFLNLSRRTLQRRLAEEDTSFKEVVDETRRDVALRYVGNPRVPIKEVSYLLGFSEPSNFTRAFRRWTGKSPSDYRLSGD
jgi:AraC-like DNA-binding protein